MFTVIQEIQQQIYKDVYQGTELVGLINMTYPALFP